jgi:hypothetical protein
MNTRFWGLCVVFLIFGLAASAQGAVAGSERDALVGKRFEPGGLDSNKVVADGQQG